MHRWSELAERVAATTRTSEKTSLLADYLHDLAPDDSWFADTHHLNATGSDGLSRELSRRLGDDFTNGARCRVPVD